MPDLRFWLAFVAAFTIVVFVLMVLAIIVEYWPRGKMTAEDRMQRALKMVMIGAAAFVILCGLVIAAVAHDHDHPELNAWYSGVKQPDTGISCCGPSDAYHCDEGARGSQVTCKINDFRDDKKLNRVHVPNGTVIDIPQHKINKDPNPAGRAVVWLSPAGHVWCFVGISGS